jgi:sigma-B regulation protein RsbU (phosphoserine phosphatase)
VQIGSVELPLRPGGGGGAGARSDDVFFARRARGQGLLDRPVIVWGEISRPYLALADGAPAAEHVVASLAASPRLIHRHLFSSDAEINTAAWAAIVVVAFLLFDIYAIAVLMAAFLSFGLTRAVNRLSRATDAVGRGDFSVRIPVRRKDQVGDLQRSFNQMTGHLQELVATAAQKEALDAELEIARRLQKSLLPSQGPSAAPPSLEFATHFEPSAAIGGDYFDILRGADGRLVVIIADVSGHGLPAGLRMAMLKAGLQLLVEDRRTGDEILQRLDAVVRSAEGPRSFVTATLAVVDARDGSIELHNAGHPPTYRVDRRGERVEEILLPGAALGGLGTEHGRAKLVLEPGETLVWLSDGLIEAADPTGAPFGYDRVLAALRGGGGAGAIRDRLLEQVRRHSAGRGVEDDRTVVVLRYVGMPSEA